MERKHKYGEPWSIQVGKGSTQLHFTCSDDGSTASAFCENDIDFNDANLDVMERMVACVNALAAFDNPAAAVAAMEAVAHWSRQYVMAIEREFGPQPKFGQGIVGNLHDALTTLSAAVKGGGG